MDFFPPGLVVLIALLAVIGIIIYILVNNMKVTRIILQKIALALGIIIVLNLFFNVGIAAFYKQPKYEDICGPETKKHYDTQEACEEMGGEWLAYNPHEKPVRIVEGIGVVDGEEEYCNAQATCSKEYDAAKNLYNRNVFIVLVLLGGVSVGAGILFSGVTAVSSGFLYGGLISFLIGSTRYWSDMNEYLRFGILGLVLAGLIWLGYRKLKD